MTPKRCSVCARLLSRPAMRPLARSLFPAVLGFAAQLIGCSTNVGDECTASAECGPGRFCDRASRGGYCTVSPCSPNSCPDNSVCVRFENEQTFCMALCTAEDDCRDGYECVEDEGAPVAYCRQANAH